jgi:REP element-mobilizing transposase RayT
MPYWRLYYHFVWGTKNRVPVINESFEAPLHGAMAAKAGELGGIVHAIGGIQDHVHLAVSVPPKLALSRFIGQVKGNSSHFVNHVLRLDFSFYWQEEYGVQSFGERNLPYVVRYVKNQREHHEEGTIVDRLEQVG